MQLVSLCGLAAALLLTSACAPEEAPAAARTAPPPVADPPKAADQSAEAPSPPRFTSDEGLALDVPYVPTPEGVVEAMMRLGEVDAADYVVDLGPGDGRIAVEAGKRGARAFGVDLNPVRIREAEANARAADVKDRVTFRQADLFDTAIADATVLTMYLLPEVNLRLRPRILKELKPGTRVVSHAFDMGDWTPDQSVTAADARVHLWIVPADVGGRWTLTGEGGGVLVLNQTYQNVTGSLGGAPIRGAVLSGDRLSFTADTRAGPRRFAGRVQGGAIVPAVGAPAQPPAAGAPAAPARDWRLARAA